MLNLTLKISEHKPDHTAIVHFKDNLSLSLPHIVFCMRFQATRLGARVVVVVVGAEGGGGVGSMRSREREYLSPYHNVPAVRTAPLLSPDGH